MSEIALTGTTLEERRQWLSDLLKSGIYQVTFTKVNGETRVMPCTLKWELFSEEDRGNLSEEPVEETPPKNRESLPVWVTDISEWRSFKVMNVTKVETL